MSMAYKSPNRPPKPVNFKAECIDDSGRPNVIPLSRWPKKGCVYTVVGYSAMLSQGVYGFWLKELDISDCHPYKNFLSSRFAPVDSASFEDSMSESAPKTKEEEFELETA